MRETLISLSFKLLFFSICIPNAKGQDYIPVVDTQFTSYNILVEFPDFFTTDSIIFTGDSIIQPFKYSCFYNYYSGAKYFVRFSEDNSKGYLLTSEQEFKIFDLNLIKNDSFVFYYLQSENNDTTTVDSVYFLNDRKHVRFYKKLQLFNGENPSFEFIEGVGSNLGLFYQFIGYPENNSNFLLCAYNSEGITYLNNSFNSGCRVNISVGIDLSKGKSNDNNLVVFQNPSTDRITVKISENRNERTQIYLFDYMGRLVLAKIETANSFEIEMPAIPAGIYTILIRSLSSNITYSKKFLYSK